MTISKAAGSNVLPASVTQVGTTPRTVWANPRPSPGPIGDGDVSDACERQRHGNRPPSTTRTDQQHPRGGVEGALDRNRLNHCDPVKGLADPPAVRVHTDDVDRTAGPGLAATAHRTGRRP